jgi:hypothetical protein
MTGEERDQKTISGHLLIICTMLVSANQVLAKRSMMIQSTWLYRPDCRVRAD